MKKVTIIFLMLAVFAVTKAQKPAFRFAFISDTHVGSPDGKAEEDLRRTVADINQMKDIAFVIITGDITELGMDDELRRASQILKELKVPLYIIPGNHDSGWSESGGVSFAQFFGDDKFSFEYNGIRFIGCASGPYVRMSDGHVPRAAVNWLDAELKKLKPNQPIIFFNHYPINDELDNWYEITDRLRQYNTWAILCGHGHTNRAFNFEDIPGVMGRSNLRAKADTGGYNLVDVRTDSILFSERRPGGATLKSWTGIKIGNPINIPGKKYKRPDYSINDSNRYIERSWTYAADANIISTPAVSGDNVIVGNQQGDVLCVSSATGKQKWKYKTLGSIFSSPAIAGNLVVLGSGDKNIYCLDVNTGKLQWKMLTGAAVLGSPLINGDTVFIGGSDHYFMAINVKTGKSIWLFQGLDGPVVSTPLLYQGNIIFGAWDKNLYSVKSSTGELNWKWNNGSPVRNYSPASCIPVADNGIIYIVAPDRYITALDAGSGKVDWRNNDGGVRESIGMSEDKKWIYCKSMQDTIVAYAASSEKQSAAWKMPCGFGYEHVPSMLIERDGFVFFGTKNGVVYCINPATKEVVWRYKIDNSMVNTVNVVDKHTIVASTMDGKIELLKMKGY